MDVLDDILQTLGLKGALYFRTDFSGPWSVQVPELGQAARFHLVIQGECHVGFADGEQLRLGPGDLVLIPRGRAHVLSDQPAAAAPALETVLQDAGYDGRGVLVLGEGDEAASTQMICGHFTFRERADHPLLRLLPGHLLTTALHRARDPWLDDVLRLAARRIYGEDFGSHAAVTRFSEIIYIELLRAGLQRPDRQADLGLVLDAFRDRHVGQALELIHTRPSDPWSVESLAAEVGMSRSRFAERFGSMMGIGPMTYLTDWRLQRALALLDDSRCTVQEVAVRTGYQSPAAFTRAFAGKFGLPPSEYRREMV